MGHREALSEAREIFGPRAGVQSVMFKDGRLYRRVGICRRIRGVGDVLVVYGEGATWKSALLSGRETVALGASAPVAPH